MSYITAIKELLNSDLKALIHQISGYEESSEEFQKIEEKSWSTILNRSYISVADDQVEKTIQGFVEKFVFHGFNVKAQNLKLLINIYSDLEYFKNNTNGSLKWNLIDFLTRLSHKPTCADNDDVPFDVERLKQVSPIENDDIDWGTYLKEGLEKFVLPESDEDSWSSDSLVMENKEEVEIPKKLDVSIPGPSKVQERKDLVLENLRKIEKSEEWLIENTQKPWWEIPDFRETPQSNLRNCFEWEQKMEKQGNKIENIRILSEYKVLRELIWVCYEPPDHPGTFFIEATNQGYKSSGRISIASLTPPEFSSVIDTFFCSYLLSIKVLRNFVSAMRKVELDNINVPFIYVAYGYALRRILLPYHSKLIEIEQKVKRQDHTYTMRNLFKDIRSWLRHLQFVHEIHQKAVYSNYEQEENWKCSLRLLSVLYNEIIASDNWRKQTALSLFLDSFYCYLDIFDDMLSNFTFSNPTNEFVIYRSKDEVIGIEIQDYMTFLNTIAGPSLNLWKMFFDLCLKALSSRHFLFQLDKVSSFNEQHSVKVAFFNGLIEDISDTLKDFFPNYIRTFPSIPETPDYLLPLKEPTFREYEISRKGTNFFTLVEDNTRYMVEKIFDSYRIPTKPLPKETILDCFLKDIKDCDITLIPVEDYIFKSVHDAIECNLEPKGFISKIVLEEYKLLEHLKYLWKVVFIHIAPMVPAVLNKLSETSSSCGNLTDCLRDSIFEYMPSDIIPRFSLVFSDVPVSILSNNLLEKIDYLSIRYEVHPQLRLIITEEMFSDYGKIFRFLLQLKFAYKTLHKLRYGLFDDSSQRARRLFSLKFWLLHTVTAFHKYFCSLSEINVLNNIKKVCEETNYLYSVQTAHNKFIKQCGRHCFFKNGKMQKLLRQLFALCETLLQFWFLEGRGLLTISKIEQLEKDYLQVIKLLAIQIEIIFLKNTHFKYNLHFEMLHDEIIYNMPATWE